MLHFLAPQVKEPLSLELSEHSTINDNNICLKLINFRDFRILEC